MKQDYKKRKTQNAKFKSLLFVILIVLLAYSPVKAQFVRGADVGWLSEMEASGKLFYNQLGVQKDVLDILKDYSLNTIRLRVWVNPTSGYCNKADVLAMAIRAKNKGYRLLIDFHYSDTWADPGQQTKPAAWTAYSFNSLMTAVYNHTTDVLNTLKTNGITPEWVQIGNETNDGMLWSDGRATVSMQNFAWLINTGNDAAKSVFPSIKTIVHLANGDNNTLYRWMFDGLTTYSARYDVIGMSVYPSPTTWATTTAAVLTNMNDMVSRYGKEVMICEIGMSYTSPGESKACVIDMINKVKSVTSGKGLGVLYWEPQCYNWQGYDKGAFDLTGKPTIALQGFLYDSYNLVTNGDFEADGVATQTPTGWTEWSNGNLDAGKTEAGGYSAAYRLSHYKTTAYQMSTYQLKTGLTNGIYTLRAWVKSSGGQTACWMSAKNYGGTEKTVTLPTTGTWTQVIIPNINVTNGQCQIGFWSDAASGQWLNADYIEFYKSNSTTARTTTFEDAPVTVSKNNSEAETLHAFPSPFKNQLNIGYKLDKDEAVNITLYNTSGSMNKVLLNKNQTKGSYSLVYNAENEAPGIYFVKIKHGSRSTVRKIFRTQ